MSTFDVSAVAREVLSLMRSGDSLTQDATPVAVATAKRPTFRKPRRRGGKQGSACEPEQRPVERFGKPLDRVFSGWFTRASGKPEGDKIVAQACFEVPGKGICNVRVFAEGWASIEFPSLSSYRQNVLAVRPEVWACVMHVMRSKACTDIHEFLGQHGLRERG